MCFYFSHHNVTGSLLLQFDRYALAPPCAAHGRFFVRVQVPCPALPSLCPAPCQALFITALPNLPNKCVPFDCQPEHKSHSQPSQSFHRCPLVSKQESNIANIQQHILIFPCSALSLSTEPFLLLSTTFNFHFLSNTCQSTCETSEKKWRLR